jgi:predicted Zn-dependent protease
MPTAEQLYDEAIKLQQAGKIEDAIGKLEALLGESPNYALAHTALSAFYGKLERHEEAVEHARKVCDLESDDPFSYIALSITCQRAGLIPEAEQAMTQSMHKQWELRQKPQA